VIGLVAGIICYFAISLKFKFGYDDSLDVVGVHMVGGIIGALLTGVFADKLFTGVGDKGAIFGNWGQVGDQAIGVGATIGYSLVVSLILIFIVDKVVGLRVSEEDEMGGLDLALHSEAAYSTAD
jgi:Amt family ammonium transporter